jgi:hypothetical protein
LSLASTAVLTASVTTPGVQLLTTGAVVYRVLVAVLLAEALLFELAAELATELAVELAVLDEAAEEETEEATEDAVLEFAAADVLELLWLLAVLLLEFVLEPESPPPPPPHADSAETMKARTSRGTECDDLE